jgi:hypothetical protein
MEEVYKSKIRRPKNIGCRLSEEENQRVVAAAQRDNVPVADWFRHAILAALDSNKQPSNAVLLAQIDELKRAIPALSGNKKEPTNQILLEQICAVRQLLILFFPQIIRGAKPTDAEIGILCNNAFHRRFVDADRVINEAAAATGNNKKSVR